MSRRYRPVQMPVWLIAKIDARRAAIEKAQNQCGESNRPVVADSDSDEFARWKVIEFLFRRDELAAARKRRNADRRRAKKKALRQAAQQAAQVADCLGGFSTH